jgi:hypothetical protein
MLKLTWDSRNQKFFIRGTSQADAEKYVYDNLHTDEFLNINITGKTKVIFSQPEN